MGVVTWDVCNVTDTTNSTTSLLGKTVEFPVIPRANLYRSDIAISVTSLFFFLPPLKGTAVNWVIDGSLKVSKDQDG